MTDSRTFPHGVPSWVDTEQPDVDAALEFYGGLFGWTFNQATPPDVPFTYVIAQLDGQDVAGIGGPAAAGSDIEVAPGWNTYIAVDDADAAAAEVEAAGGRVVAPPSDSGEGGRSVGCEDPAGIAFRLWQAKRRLGVQVANTPAAWNFSDLHTRDPAHGADFYADVFGWAVDDVGFATLLRRPGYGDHLASTVDPDIYERQSGVTAPPGFADAIGWVAALPDGEQPHWHVSFTVADRDDIASAAERLGATVMSSTDTDWTREVLIRDPQGGLFTGSQFTPGG